VAVALGLADYLRDPWLRERTGQPPLGRDPAAERRAALQYLAAQPAAWRDLVRGKADALPPLARSARIVVFLIAENEATIIAACLTAISSDLVSSGLQHAAEVLVVRQHRAGATLDDTAGQVTSWARRHDEIPVRLIEVEWPADCATFLPLSRKLAVDVVADRAVAADSGHPLYLITEDADVEWIERGRARYVVDTFDRRPDLDALRGWHLRSLDLLEYLPLFVERLTWRACEFALSGRWLRPECNQRYSFVWNRVVTAGWNVAFTLEAYLLAGGYTTTVELFEDRDLGQRISVMRGRHTPAGFIPTTTSVEWMPFEACSDGRRALAALADSTDLYGSQPSVTGFVAATSAVRSWSMADAIEFARQPAPHALADVLARRKAELLPMVANDRSTLEHMMQAAWQSLGVANMTDVPALRARQQAFQAAARAVAAGAPSGPHAAALGRPGDLALVPGSSG